MFSRVENELLSHSSAFNSTQSTPLQKTGMFGGPEVSYHQTHSATDWLSILRTPYTTQNLQRKRRTDLHMTTKARKRTKSSGLMQIGVWNVRGLNRKENLLQEELKKANVDIAVIPETKKKLKGSQELEDYILLYSGVPRNKRAAAGIAIIIKAKYKKRIHSYTFGNERILQLRYKLQRGYLTLLAV
jgi:hypothetical protein